MYVLDTTRLALLLYGCFVVLVFAIPAAAIRRRRELLSVLGFAAMLAGLLFGLFSMTPFGLNSYLGDQHYVLAAIEKYSTTWRWVDFNYAHLPTYYPPLYFYVLGRIAWLLHIPAYGMVKIGFLAAALVLPPIVYRSWTPWLGKMGAMLLVVLFFLSFPQEFMFKTYEFLTAALVLPWWLYYGERLNHVENESGKQRFWLWIVGGVLGALIFQTYYYWFFILACYLPFSLIISASFGRKSWREGWSDFWRKVRLLALVALLSAWYWVPLLVSALTVGYQNFQNRWLSTGMIQINFFQLLATPEFIGLVLLAGLTYLVFRYERSRLHEILLNLTVTCFIWYLIGFVGILIGTPNLHIKAWMLSDYVLLAGVVLGLEELASHARWHRVNGRLWALSMCVTVFVLGQSYVNVTVDSALYKNSVMYTTVPTAVSQLKSVGTLSGKVFLTNEFEAVDFQPLYLFIGYNPNYANPAAQYASRLQFLKDLQSVSEPKSYAWMLQYNEFDRVTDIWMTEPFLRLGFDNYPNGTSVTDVTVPQGYQTSSDFTRVAGTDIYRVNRVPKTAFKDFNVYELAVASQFAEPSLRKSIDAAFLIRVQTTHDTVLLQDSLPVVASNRQFTQAISRRLANS